MLNWKNRVDGVSVDRTGTGFEREQEHAGRSTSFHPWFGVFLVCIGTPKALSKAVKGGE